jgi:hypothetical protein
MPAERPNSNLPGALPVSGPEAAGERRSRPLAVRSLVSRVQGVLGGRQDSQQDDSAVLLSHGGGQVGKCSRCGTSLGGYLVKAAADGVVHLACPTPRQIARRKRWGR